MTRGSWSVLCALVMGATACERGVDRIPPAADAAASAPASADCPPDAPGERVRIVPARREADRDVMRVSPEPALGGEASVMARPDLNADGRHDMILRFFELCGNAGECPWAAYAACGSDEYATVWPPSYAVGVEALTQRASGWAELRETRRTTNQREDFAATRTLRVDGGRYVPVPESEARLP